MVLALNFGSFQKRECPRLFRPRRVSLARLRSTGIYTMATPILIGIGALAAALGGRHLLRQRAAQVADKWVKGGFQQKMDRREALMVLGLKCVEIFHLLFEAHTGYKEMAQQCEPSSRTHIVES